MNKRLMMIAAFAIAFVFNTEPVHAAEQSLVATPAAPPMIVSYLQLSGYEAHYGYRYQLIKTILEITRPEFGDYQLAPYTSVASAVRYAQMLTEGRLLNLMWASPGTPIASGDVIGIPVDILNGMVGFRVCLINKNSDTELSHITNIKELAGIKIGQAPWSDRAVYHMNKLTEVDAPNFDSLFMMLSAKRFDCIALGADEVTRIYNTKKVQYPFLEIDTKLLIHYHYPVYFYVSKKNPLLAKRMAVGLQKMQENGDFKRLFYQYHAENLMRLALDKRTLICLQSPFSNAPDQCVVPSFK